MRSNVRFLTLSGLFISLAGIGLVALLFRSMYDAKTTANLLMREGAIFLLLAVLVWIVKREGLSLPRFDYSIRGLIKSLLLGLLGTIVCFVVVLLGLEALKFFGMEMHSSNEKAIPLAVTIIIILRAAIVEEFFYRWYAIDRLKSILHNLPLSALISATAFAMFHYSQGVAGVIVIFLLGITLTIFYLKTKNLLAVMLAHFMIDFIPNVLM
jgi:uncharacterized protein